MRKEINQAIFLDRDGTINVDKGYLYRKKDIEFLNGAVNALKILCNMGFILIIITNQSGIARGYYTEQEFIELDYWMKEELKNQEVRISKTYYCPHCSEGKIKKYVKECKCRKPKTKLFWDAKIDFSINMEKSFAIGNSMRDIMICKESGVKGILLSESQIDLLENNIYVCKNWDEILKVITTNIYK